MKYLTQLLLLSTVVAISSLIAMAAVWEPKSDKNTTIVIKNSTDYYIQLANVKFTARNGITGELEPATQDKTEVIGKTTGQGKTISFPLGEKETTDVNLLDKEGKVLHSWKGVRFNAYGRTYLKPEYSIADKKVKIGGYIQVEDFRPKDVHLTEYHNYTIELQQL